MSKYNKVQYIIKIDYAIPTMKHKWSISGQNHVFVILHKRKNRIGKPFVGGIIENINLSKINDALLYLD